MNKELTPTGSRVLSPLRYTQISDYDYVGVYSVGLREELIMDGFEEITTYFPNSLRFEKSDGHKRYDVFLFTNKRLFIRYLTAQKIVLKLNLYDKLGKVDFLKVFNMMWQK